MKRKSRPVPTSPRAKSRLKIELSLVNRSGSAVPQAFLHRCVKELALELSRELGRVPMGRRILKNRGGSSKTLVVAFLAPTAARQLNLEFRKRDYATDVLSFAAMDPNEFGELVICPEVISRQAREHGLLVREELAYMILHGFLHLLGYDHERSRKNAKEMFALQDAVFARLLKLQGSSRAAEFSSSRAAISMREPVS